MLRRNPAARFLRLGSLLILSAAFPTAFAEEGGLAPIGSESELSEYLQGIQEAERAEWEAFQGSNDGTSLEEVVTTGSRAAPASITNSQHAGVDEGGIVKQHEDHLVILRRGRLFTVDISDTRLRPVASINAFAPGMNGDDTWYDEMLISGNTVVVIGYSYGLDATEVGIFNINSNGALRHRATYHLRSFDYYSSRNYASRLIGSKLVLYAPLSLSRGSGNPLDVLPAMSKWTESEEESEFKRIIAARDVYRPPVSGKHARVLHSMTVCDLARREIECRATGVIGDWGRVFYVSPKAMYVWVDTPGAESDATLVRMPLTGTSPSAINVSGGPIDQFSFDESRRTLNVLVESAFEGDAMWMAERDANVGEDVALLSIPVHSFGDGSTSAPKTAYRLLPPLKNNGVLHNRFVGNYLLYGTGEGWWENDTALANLVVVPTRGGTIREIELPHGVDRIEAAGSDAVVVGESGPDLHFSGVKLSKTPKVAQHYVMKDAAQGEVRSHGFFYKADGRGGGVLGLPVNNPAAPGYEHLFEESAGITFLRKTSSDFTELGQLDAHDEGAIDDGCVSSCVDWYGNSRPIFIEDRLFALLGYELVEGRRHGASIREVRRVNFAPRVVTAALEP